MTTRRGFLGRLAAAAAALALPKVLPAEELTGVQQVLIDEQRYVPLPSPAPSPVRPAALYDADSRFVCHGELDLTAGVFRYVEQRAPYGGVAWHLEGDYLPPPHGLDYVECALPLYDRGTKDGWPVLWEGRYGYVFRTDEGPLLHLDPKRSRMGYRG